MFNTASEGALSTLKQHGSWCNRCCFSLVAYMCQYPSLLEILCFVKSEGSHWLMTDQAHRDGVWHTVARQCISGWQTGLTLRQAAAESVLYASEVKANMINEMPNHENDTHSGSHPAHDSPDQAEEVHIHCANKH